MHPSKRNTKVNNFAVEASLAHPGKTKDISEVGASELAGQKDCRVKQRPRSRRSLPGAVGLWAFLSKIGSPRGFGAG